MIEYDKFIYYVINPKNEKELIKYIAQYKLDMDDNYFKYESHKLNKGELFYYFSINKKYLGRDQTNIDFTLYEDCHPKVSKLKLKTKHKLWKS